MTVMNKVFIGLFLLLLISLSISIFLLEWEYSFVTMEGRMYQVTEESLEENALGDLIGQVTAIANTPPDQYHENISNHYPIGTPYYKIIRVPVEDAIAIKENGNYYKAIYQKNVIFYWEKLYPYVIPIIFLGVLVLLYRFRINIKKVYSNSLS
ncbi:hypothetical protein SAMN05216179_0134 [Gracilibacillus kekensis]|uniref:Uncharacterized protein n=2 Tax=Gracilibacillus kekensis TaxID=1027249 RepID=A0A1M7IRN6_9BACI|nr:hypothetical protein SAMN05216179_0134 [Gracilibacillus kekensis]